MKTEDGRLIVIGGSSRSGKTAYVRRQVERGGLPAANRVFVWDPDSQWCQLRGFVTVRSRRAMREAATGKGPRKVAYIPTAARFRGDFMHWADCVLGAGTEYGPLVAVAEELADVSNAGKAPETWGMLVRRGLKRGITLFAISQRWAEADKTVMGNMSELVMFRQVRLKDAKYLAEETGVEAAAIHGLQQLEYIRFNPDVGADPVQKLKF